jgi:hypothetical protein
MHMNTFRTDTHNNPTAFTTDVAAEARIKLGVDYTVGEPFKIITPVLILHTARLIGDPIALTIRVIDALSFMTTHGTPISRWGYITMPAFLWHELSPVQKRDVIGWMYQREGGTTMKNLFPNYGKL